MGYCYLIGHIAEDHMHTDITLTLRNHNRSTALEVTFNSNLAEFRYRTVSEMNLYLYIKNLVNGLV